MGGTCGPHAASRVQRGAASYDYYYCDANGNVTGGSTLGASYDFNNQPWQIHRIGEGIANFAYSADGAVFKSVTAGNTNR